MNKCKEYLANIYKSIKTNLDSLDPIEDRATIQGLIEACNKFYVSLFAAKKGIFGQRQMDKNLAQNAPKVRDDKQPREKQTTVVTTKIKGLGKGSPGCARKQNVTKRQARTRSSESFTARKRRRMQPSTQPPRPIAPRLEKGQASTADPPDVSSQTTIFPTTSTTSDATTPADDTSELSKSQEETEERRQPLRAQTVPKWNGTKRVQLIRQMCGAEKDNQPNDRELEMFWTTMDEWETVDKRIVAALQTIWDEIAQDRTSSTPEKILRLANTPNGVTNCIQHLIGNVLSQHVRNLDSEQSPQKRNYTAQCEELAEQFKDVHYERYVKTLENCECPSCESVLDFDKMYTRYHDSKESEHPEAITAPVLFENRPIHCDATEVSAQSMRVEFSGFSDTSLLKCLYFAKSTPLFSPPAISLGTPTDVQTVTTKYMEAFLQERKLQDPVPRSWKLAGAYYDEDVHKRIEVPKESLHLFDADSGEITVVPDSERALHSLVTHGNKIRFRMRMCDAPETEHSVCIYKQSEGSPTLSKFVERHMGIEALRVARQTLFEASKVYLQVDIDRHGQVSTPTKDQFGRRLLYITLRDNDNKHRNFADLLALSGHTLSFYTTGIDTCLDRYMRDAIEHKRGIFSLPDEIFTYPYRPWDLRRLWNDVDNARRYAELRPILNRPSDPNVWRGTCGDCGTYDAGSETSDNFFFNIHSSTLFWESRCFAAKSTIPDAGLGLFIKPHDNTIEVKEHLCLYAERSTNLKEITDSGSSRAYAMYVPRKKLWFDAEVETGNNLGRFANQPGVLEAFSEIKRLSNTDLPLLTTEDWIKIEKDLDQKCNAYYDTVGDQLVVKAQKQFPKTHQPVEVFMNYGGLKDYWIPLILQHMSDTNFPEELRAIVEWLQQSEECNWTAEQRRDWSPAV